ncbi:lateral signaling target protein 2 homolog [Diorhabda sublineata]|uniref:lateral signaling target protein 2 homolog n=1 Tax=Diorhabda sublineata TaxID=1163346 RepID=UPI0024E159A5|nr:lateral signaling target protein 2 homolog [Diorhabda sublineata]XP_056642779.1 lateral signaling target protein 2 homolog [Diorhabda sublineata]
MDSIRKWLYKPKKDDKSLLAQFFYADEDLNIVANELDSFDGRKDPDRCTTLVSQLRQAQDKVLTITNAIMDVLIGNERANRDFRVKFPEDVLQENLAGQLWFGAECLAAGSSIMNREFESNAMRPLAKAVTRGLENVRNLLRDTCLRNNTPNGPIKLDSNELVTEVLLESLKIFDRLFAEFEFAYVSAMVPVKSTQEYELQELIGVLFSETLQRALKMSLLTQEMVDDCDPALMFTIPRLAIVSGLLIFPNGPLCIDKPIEEMSEMFRPFRTLLHKIRELLFTLNKLELYRLEKLLCDNEQIEDVKSVSELGVNNDLLEFISPFYTDYTLGQYSVDNYTKSDRYNAGSSSKCTKQETDHMEKGPSTSGYLFPQNAIQNTMIAANIRAHSLVSNHDSPPEHDCLEIISVAAATLSSILNTQGEESGKITVELGSPNDSGVSTETASLERSPSLDINDSKNGCACAGNSSSPVCNCHRTSTKADPCVEKSRYQAEKILSKSSLPLRKRKGNNGPKNSLDDGFSSTGSSETSSFNSTCADDEEIAMAMQAAELATKNEVRAKYKSSEDLLHRLFVCIAGVADQLQTNFACDLRNILKSVFLINASDTSAEPPPAKIVEPNNLDNNIEYHPTESEVIENNNEFSVDPNILAQEALFDSDIYFHLDSEDESPEYSNHPRQQQEEDRNLNSLSSDLNRYASLREDIANLQSREISQTEPDIHNLDPSTYSQPPIWIPDVEAPKCMSCGVNFTVVKRRHHCRNCGKVFCARCSSNSVPLPKFGHVKPVRVCNRCFIYNLTPFTM